MTARFLPPTAFLLLALCGAAAPARADGAPVDPVSAEAQSRPTVVPDGHGGAIVSYKTTSLRIGAVHVNGAGEPDGGIGFAPAVLPLGLEADEPPRLSLPADTQLVLVGDRSPSSEPALTSLRSGGAASTGFPVDLPFPLTHPAVVAGVAGRTVLIAKGSDAISFWTLRAAVVTRDGSVESSVQLPSTLQFFNSDRITAASDGAGGVIAVIPYYDQLSTGSKDLAVLRIAADGSRPWGDQPRPFILAARDQVDPHVVPDGAGGAIMVWTDPRSSLRSADIFGMRITADGARAAGWGFYGSGVCLADGYQSEPRLTRDGVGGVWVIWLDQRGDSAGDLRYTHLLGNGVLAPGFPADGRVLCEAPGAQREAALTGDGAGGFFAVWRDERSGEADVYTHHVLPSGEFSPEWPVNGRALSTAPGAQDQPAIAPSSAGHAVVAWRDARAATTRVYAAGLDDPSTVGVPAAGLVRLALAASARARGGIECALSLGEPGPARLELLDVAGRRRASLAFEGPLANTRATLAEVLAPGLYFVRLTQGRERALRRVLVTR